MPRKTYKSRNCIDWIKSIGCEVRFIYDGIEGELKIIDYNFKEQKVLVEYKNQPFKIHSCSLQTCSIGRVIGEYTKEFKVDINTTFNDSDRNLTITDKKYVSHDPKPAKRNQNRNYKYYKYHCNTCGFEDWILESNLLHHEVGCSCCNGKSVYAGINDIATTAPHLVKFLVDKSDANKYTAQSHKKVKARCPVCSSHEYYISVAKLNNQGFSCKSCGDGISYPEKVMFNVLKQLQIDIIVQYSVKEAIWCGKYRYDFYIPYLNCIIEVHGMQHYEDTSRSKYLDVHKNDIDKKELALKNGVSHYKSIDCRKSDINYIKGSIIKSFSGLINLDSVDWKLVEEQSLNNLVKEVCDIKKENPDYIASDIGKITHLSGNAVRTYLKKGAKIGWCDYNAKKERYVKKVACLTTKKIFNSIIEASQYAGLKGSSRIILVCQGKANSAGKHPETGEPLRWIYYEDWLNLQNKEEPKGKENDKEGDLL